MTGTELFGDMEETLSPKERWMRDNSVKVWVTTGHDQLQGKHKASNGKHEAIGGSKDEAVARLAHILWAKENIKLWNME
tara:strand:- start:7 stop:243 length:237 start_codon:yes stop_codon:yes gene_type:complete